MALGHIMGVTSSVALGCGFLPATQFSNVNTSFFSLKTFRLICNSMGVLNASHWRRAEKYELSQCRLSVAS